MQHGADFIGYYTEQKKLSRFFNLLNKYYIAYLRKNYYFDHKWLFLQ